MNSFRTISSALILATSLAACADDSAKGATNDGETNGSFNNGPNNGDSSDGNNGVFVPEIEDEFDFAAPAVVGTKVFVANETSNTVAVIDSLTLAIRTVPVGFGPTHVVGPKESVEDSRIYVLNAGASTVTVVEPDQFDTTSIPVMRRANSLAASPRGDFAMAWFDEDLIEPGEQAGDLSSVTLVTGEGDAYQIAVGFRVDEVIFTEEGDTALVLTDDGVSIISMTAVTEDFVAPPVAVLPPDLQAFDRTDREVLVAPDGSYAVARVGNNDLLILTELATGDQWRVPLPGAPTDLDWVKQDSLKLLAMIPGANVAVVAEVPAGLQALAALPPVVTPQPDAGMDAGADAGTDAGSDVGSGAGVDAGADVGVDAATDAGIDADADTGPKPGTIWSPVTGVSYLALQHNRLGAAEVDDDGEVALLFSTLEGRLGGVLLDLQDLGQRAIYFEKGVRGAVADPRAESFVVLHTREEGGVPPTATPADPEYIARSWGVSIVDVESGVTRLVLTEQQPGDVALWNDGSLARLYMIFQGPPPQTTVMPSHRDVLRVDLDSFAIESFRVPSLPDGVGIVPAARRVYVNQIHPQGRITFVDVDDDTRQTVTGYQLNAGID